MAEFFFTKVEGPEAVFGICSVEKMFLEIFQNSQEKTCARNLC